MDIEFLEEFSASSDHVIVKRKRSKRSRPSSSTSASSTSCIVSHGSMPPSSPVASSSTCTEEDEDMANCLILLARGGAGYSPAAKRIDDGGKFISRQLSELDAAGKAGAYVYDCKTCGRSFPSFQALGGHRASHKKPRPPPAVSPLDHRKSPPIDYRKEAEQTEFTTVDAFSQPPILTRPPEVKPKIHECSLCGSEFGSGQALGGHMRKHRSEITRRSNPAPSEKTGAVLELDLNLPAAPEEEDDRTSGFDRFAKSSQHPGLLLGTAPPPLVDCHY